MLIQTAELTPSSLTPAESYQTYCGLDSCLTLEIWQELQRTYQPTHIYEFEKALQAPYLELMQRGFRVDRLAAAEAARELQQRREALQQTLDQLASAVWDKQTKWLRDKSLHYLNPRSPAQLLEFFYGALRIPEIWISQKGERKLSLNREVLEKLEKNYLYARPFVRLILSIRDIGKQLDVLEGEIDPDGRFRSSYNIAGTETGRPSSSASAFGTGSNAQNIAPGLRFIFCADPGYKLCVIDLEQVEARDTGFFIGCLFDDWTFLNNCEAGDLHTNNCKLIWPQLPWTDDPKKDKALAEEPFYRDFSYRDMAKRGGHLCLTEDHEVLTRDGWVSIASKPAEILTWKEDKARFAPVLNWLDEPYTGELHEFEGSAYSALMTAKHRVPYKADQRTSYYKTRVAERGPATFLPMGSGFIGGDEVVPARLIAAFMSDGYQATSQTMEFDLRKERKKERLKWLCEMYGVELRISSTDHRMRVRGNLPKKAGSFMLNWTMQCIVDFLDEYKYWDGCVKTTNVQTLLYSVDREHLDWIKTLGRITGIGGAIFSETKKSSYKPGTVLYSLSQNKRQFASGNQIVWTKISADKRRVLCPTTEDGFFFIRRHEKISVTGNSNYYGTAWTASRHLKCPIEIMEEFQARYCRGGIIAGQQIEPAFPGIPRYWAWIAEQLQTTHQLVTPFGRRRHFFGRPGDDTTLREAIAFVPQSTTADRMNLGLWRTWKHEPRAQLLAQTYDSITFQYREDQDENDIIQHVLSLLAVELRAPSGRSYVVPGEAKIGWNWGRVHNSKTPIGRGNRYNPEGLIKWSATQPDTRQRSTGLSRIAS